MIIFRCERQTIFNQNLSICQWKDCCPGTPVFRCLTFFTFNKNKITCGHVSHLSRVNVHRRLRLGLSRGHWLKPREGTLLYKTEQYINSVRLYNITLPHFTGFWLSMILLLLSSETPSLNKHCTRIFNAYVFITQNLSLIYFFIFLYNIFWLKLTCWYLSKYSIYVYCGGLEAVQCTASSQGTVPRWVTKWITPI